VAAAAATPLLLAEAVAVAGAAAAAVAVYTARHRCEHRAAYRRVRTAGEIREAPSPWLPRGWLAKTMICFFNTHATSSEVSASNSDDSSS
jgi:hypothetical protein